ncbi:unnamed protein product [Polarella glacialis]|uniref:Uncharacterized protein n=1 Tax=Polarella glacialis TaxID=89957 RepID=A0A813J9F3_POLGL|nr:unnamed protein product [Polarella glacialis]
MMRRVSARRKAISKAKAKAKGKGCTKNDKGTIAKASASSSAAPKAKAKAKAKANSSATSTPTPKRPAPPVAGTTVHYNGGKAHRSDLNRCWRVFLKTGDRCDKRVLWHGDEKASWRKAMDLIDGA